MQNSLPEELKEDSSTLGVDWDKFIRTFLKTDLTWVSMIGQLEFPDEIYINTLSICHIRVNAAIVFGKVGHNMFAQKFATH